MTYFLQHQLLDNSDSARSDDEALTEGKSLPSIGFPKVPYLPDLAIGLMPVKSFIPNKSHQ